MDKIVRLSARLPCDARSAFRLFADARLLESWLAPSAVVEPVAGGTYELFWEPDDRENNSTLGCRVTSVEPDQFISFEWRSPKQFKHFADDADPLTHVVVFFIPAGGGTDVHLIHSGWRRTVEWEEARLWQERAWGVAFAELRKRASLQD